MTSVTVEIPDEVIRALGVPDNQLAPEIRLAIAFNLCSRGLLSTSLAARFAEMAYAEFLEAAARRKVELFPVDIDELKEEVARGLPSGGQRLTGDLAGQSRPG